MSEQPSDRRDSGMEYIYVAADPSGGLGIWCAACESKLAGDEQGIVTAEEVTTVAGVHLAAAHGIEGPT